MVRLVAQILFLAASLVPLSAVAAPEPPPQTAVDALMTLSAGPASDWANSHPGTEDDAQMREACAIQAGLAARGQFRPSYGSGMACLHGVLKRMAALPSSAGAPPPAARAFLSFLAVPFGDLVTATHLDRTLLVVDALALARVPGGPDVESAKRLLDQLRAERLRIDELRTTVFQALIELAGRPDAPPELRVTALRLGVGQGRCDRMEPLWKAAAADRETESAVRLGKALCGLAASPPCGGPVGIDPALAKDPLARALVAEIGEPMLAIADATCALAGKPLVTDLAAVPGLEHPKTFGPESKQTPFEAACAVARGRPWMFDPAKLVAVALALPEPADDKALEAQMDLLVAVGMAAPGEPPPAVIERLACLDRKQAEEAAADTGGKAALRRLGALFTAASVEMRRGGSFELIRARLEREGETWIRLIDKAIVKIRPEIDKALSCPEPKPLNLEGNLCKTLDRLLAEGPAELIASVRAISARPSPDVMERELVRLGHKGFDYLGPILDAPNLAKHLDAFDKALWAQPDIGPFLAELEARGVKAKTVQGEALVLAILRWVEGRAALGAFQLKVRDSDALILRGFLERRVNGVAAVDALSKTAGERLTRYLADGDWDKARESGFAAGVLARLSADSPDAGVIASTLLKILDHESRQALPGKPPRHVASLCALALSLSPGDVLTRMGPACGDLDPGNVAAAIVASVAEEKAGNLMSAMGRLFVAFQVHRQSGGDERGQRVLLRRIAAVGKAAGLDKVVADALSEAKAIEARLEAKTRDEPEAKEEPKKAGGLGADLGKRIDALAPKVMKAVRGSRTVKLCEGLAKRLDKVDFDPFKDVMRLSRSGQMTFQIGALTSDKEKFYFTIILEGGDSLVPIEPGWLAE
jgi:molybdenum-dependent DNA-binding transcriptional regulator ModE